MTEVQFSLAERCDQAKLESPSMRLRLSLKEEKHFVQIRENETKQSFTDRRVEKKNETIGNVARQTEKV